MTNESALSFTVTRLEISVAASWHEVRCALELPRNFRA